MDRNIFIKIYPNVVIGENAQIDEFVIIGKPPRGREPGELKTVIGNNAVIRSHTVIYAGAIIGDRFQSGHHVLIREQTEIGDQVTVGSGSVIEADVRLGRKVGVHTQAFIAAGSLLEEGCWIGPRVVLTNAKYPFCKDSKGTFKGVTIRAGAKICANATVLPGLEIGSEALIGAACVVTKNVAAREVHVGNPNRLINRIDDLSCY
jgi:acetyltransferase-like isoleucine patch superfamily enzyme